MSLRSVEETARETVGPERQTPRPTGRNDGVFRERRRLAAGRVRSGAGNEPEFADHSRAQRNDGQLSDPMRALAGRGSAQPFMATYLMTCGLVARCRRQVRMTKSALPVRVGRSHPGWDRGP